MSEFSQSTDFTLDNLEIDGKPVDGSMFFGFEIYEHAFMSGITGSVTLVETATNQFLDENSIEGNETFKIEFTTPLEERLVFDGYVNKISNRTVTANGVTTYVVEFVSSVIRENEQKRMTKRYKNQEPEIVVKDAIQRLNKDAEVPVTSDNLLGEGRPMNFLASRWTPIKVIQYVQKHGVPLKRGGQTSDDDKKREITASGTGGFLFFETRKGLRFGTSVQFLAGELSDTETKELRQSLANQSRAVEDTREQIMSYETVRNNDTQTQQRSGAFKSQLINLNLDSGVYKEQEWDSGMATEKQKKTSRTPTRIFLSTNSNERFNQECESVPKNSIDQKLLSMQQEAGTINNITDGMCRLTVPTRTDICVGDKVNLTIYQASEKSDSERDQKFSGNWIVSGIAHHFLRETNSGYTRLTCLRSTDQVDEPSSQNVETISLQPK